MATLKTKDIRNMKDEEIQKKLKELKMELVKSKVSSSKSGGSKAKEIRKIISRIYTIKNKK